MTDKDLNVNEEAVVETTEEVVETPATENVEETVEATEEAATTEEVVEAEASEDAAEEATQTEETTEAPAEAAAPAPKKNTPDTSAPIAEEFLPGNYDPFARPVNPRFANRPQQENEFEERVIEIKRVIKTTKGGRRFKFSALVVVGDKNGRIGFAVGKHIEVPDAIKKAVRLAKKNMYRVNVVGNQATIPHELIGHHGAAKVMLKPAAEGRGVIASDTVRAVVELAGIRNIYTKNLGTNNPMNVVRATMDGLTSMRTKEEIARLRDKEI